MPENVNYKIDLYYGDIGFTSDYANVLQFKNAVARDSYFNNITEKDTVNNTDFNNIQLSGNTVKIAFTDNVELSRLEKYNYIRILTRLYGTSSYSDKYEYGFIVDYSIISSSSNVTVVEFTFEVDLWQNYQFDFILKECSVERSHMNRWSKESSVPIYTRPCMELMDSFMEVVKSDKINNKAMAYVIPESGGLISSIEYREIEFALCIVSYSTADNIAIAYFPIALDYDGFIVNEYNSTTGERYLFPSVSDITSGTLQTWLNVADINNIKIVYNPSITLKAENGKTYIEDAYRPEPHYEGNAYWCRYGFSSADYADPFMESKEILIYASKPVKPTNNAVYNDNHEPMLFKAPIFKRYISNYDATELTEIPDVILKDFNTIKIMTFVSHVDSYNIINLLNTEDTTKLKLINASGVISGYDGDVANVYWKEYCMTQRESDRNMMWANILTGGLADAGSTAISAGIGYRSNAERSFLYETMGTGTHQDKAMAGMFDKYAKQAASMSVVGGITQFAAGGVNKYLSQENRELAIKNKPAAMKKTGNALTSLIRKTYGIYYTEVRCDAESYKQYANIFKKFGYFIGGVIKPDINSRKYFNYIKTNGAILTGSLNQSILAKLCRIFDNGVTIWHMDYAKGHLYEYDKENIERALIGE